MRARAKEALEKISPWKAQEEVEVPGVGTEGPVYAQRALPVHVPSHSVCLALYILLLSAYALFVIITWIVEEPATTYSTEPSKNFVPTEVEVEVGCAACTRHTTANNKWLVTYNYDGFEHCASKGRANFTDEPRQTIWLCRTTDDITDSTGLRVRLQNISDALRMNASYGRPSVKVFAGDFAVTTPLEPWHEKTLLLGLVARRDKEGCNSASDCKLEVGLYLASMQYDGKVTWGGDTWGGARLNVRMLRFAQVYTTVRRPLLDVLATIGGASTMLLCVLGGMRLVLEKAMVAPPDKRAAHAARAVKEVIASA